MDITKHIPTLISVALLGVAAMQSSAAMAYASVAALVAGMAKDAWERYHTERTTKTSDDSHRKIQDLEARITTIEFGIKTRGF